MDFSYLDALENADDKPKNHSNLPYPMFEIIVGKIGSGKTHLAFSQLLKPDFIDYKEFYFISPELTKKENMFLKMGFEKQFTKEVLFATVLKYGKFKTEQFEDFWTVVDQNTPEEFKNSNIKCVFTKKATDIPLINEFDETPKLFIIDDCGGKNEYKNLINRLVMDGRSKNCQIILIAQDFIQINPTIRRQASCISAFKHSGDSLDRLYNEMIKEVQPNKTDFITYAQRIWSEKHKYVYVNKIDEIITNDIFVEVKNKDKK